MAISPPIRAIIRVLDRFLYRGSVSLSLLRRATRWFAPRSRWVRSECTFSAAFHAERKPIVTFAQLHLAERNGDRPAGGSSIRLDRETPPQNLGILNRDISNDEARARFREKRILGSVRPGWILMDFRRTITRNESLAREHSAQRCIAQTFNSSDPLSGNVSDRSIPNLKSNTQQCFLVARIRWPRLPLVYSWLARLRVDQRNNRITRAYEIYLNKESHAVPETDNRPVLRNGDEGGKEKLATRLNLTCIRNSWLPKRNWPWRCTVTNMRIKFYRSTRDNLLRICNNV